MTVFPACLLSGPSGGEQRPEATFELAKPLRLFGVMILLFNCLCFSLGRLIPQRDWWKPQY